MEVVRDDADSGVGAVNQCLGEFHVLLGVGGLILHQNAPRIHATLDELVANALGFADGFVAALAT